MILATWNVNSINVRLEQLIEWLKTAKPDVVCLQETKIVDEKFPQARLEELGYHSAYWGQKTYNGVAILSNKPFDEVRRGFVEEKEAYDQQQRRLIEVAIGNTYIVNVYIPNGSEVGSEKYNYKLAWLEQLHGHLQNHKRMNERFAICGDFNIATEDIDIYDPVAMAGTIMCSETERTSLERIRQLGLHDLFRLHNKESGLYSWWDYRMAAFRRNMGWRIDHIWASKQLSDVCSRSWIDKAPRKLERPSDHTPVLVELSD